MKNPSTEVDDPNTTTTKEKTHISLAIREKEVNAVRYTSLIIWRNINKDDDANNISCRQASGEMGVLVEQSSYRSVCSSLCS